MVRSSRRKEGGCVYLFVGLSFCVFFFLSSVVCYMGGVLAGWLGILNSPISLPFCLFSICLLSFFCIFFRVFILFLYFPRRAWPRTVLFLSIACLFSVSYLLDLVCIIMYRCNFSLSFKFFCVKLTGRRVPGAMQFVPHSPCIMSSIAIDIVYPSCAILYMQHYHCPGYKSILGDPVIRVQPNA